MTDYSPCILVYELINLVSWRSLELYPTKEQSSTHPPQDSQINVVPFTLTTLPITVKLVRPYVMQKLTVVNTRPSWELSRTTSSFPGPFPYPGPGNEDGRTIVLFTRITTLMHCSLYLTFLSTMWSHVLWNPGINSKMCFFKPRRILKKIENFQTRSFAKPKGATTEMKALDEYIIMVLFVFILKRIRYKWPLKKTRYRRVCVFLFLQIVFF